MNRFYTLLLSGLLGLFGSGLYAQVPSVSLTSADGNVGDEVCIDLIGADFVEITGMQFTILYDPAVLMRVSASGSIGGNSVSMVTPPSAPGQIRVSYAPFSATGYTDPGPFTIGTICFEVLQDVATTVSIEDNPVPLEFTNEDQQTFEFGDVPITNGVINSGSGGGTATCTDGIMNGNETGVDCGGPDCGPCQTTPTCTDGIMNGNETGVDCGGPDCGPCQTTPTCTDGIMNGSETGVDCGGPDCGPCQTMGGNCGDGSDQFNICISDACDVAVGSNVCVDLTVKNFVNINSVQCTLNYPAANLEYVNFMPNADLNPGLLVNSPNDGEVRLVFFRSANAAVTLADDEVMTTLCFTAQSAAAAPINFTSLQVGSAAGQVPNPVGNPGQINGCGQTTSCTDGIMNGNETGVDCGGPDCAPCQTTPTCTDGIMNGNETGVDCGGPDCAPCQTTDGTCGEGSDLFNICVGEACDVAVGTNACVDLTVKNFVNINSVQCTLNYPAANLEYLSFTPNAALNPGLLVNSPNDGEVRLVFFRSANAAVTLDDDEVMATLCFTAQSAAAAPINFTSLQVGSTAGQVPNPMGNPGRINGCSSGSTCNDGIMNGDETGVDCGGSCVPCMVTCGTGTTDVEVCVGSECGAAGEEVCVPVFLGNFNNLAGVQFSLAHAAANLNYSSFSTAPVFASGTQVSQPTDGNGDPIDGVVRVIWNDPDLSGESISPDEPAFTICFTAENTLATPLTFEEPVANTLRAFNTSLSSVPISGNPGAINQNCPSEPTCSDGIQNGQETGVDCGGPDCDACPVVVCDAGTSSPSICVGEACNVPVGGTACVELTVNNFTDVTGFELRLNYPGANLELDTFIPNPVLATFIQGNPFNDGQLRLILFDPSQSGINLADGAVLGTVCYTVETTAASNLTISNLNIGTTSGNVIMPGSTTGAINGCVGGPTCTDGIMNGNETGVDCGGPDCAPCEPDPTCTDGIMNGNETGVDCGGPDCTPCAATDLTFAVGTATGGVGDQVCVNVTTTDFTNITSTGFTLNYDATVLSLASVTAGNLPELGAGNFDTSTPGAITVTYSSATPRTLAAGAVFFNVCFNVTTNDGSDLTITGGTAANGMGTNLSVIGNAGRINGEVSFDNLTLVITDANGAAGSQVCVDVNIFNGIDLAGLQFAIDYDSTKLRFVSSMGTGQLPNLQAANPNPGLLRVIWFDPNVQPNTVADGESILQICFTVLEECSTELMVSEQPPQFRIRATTAAGALVPVDRVDGTVNAGVTDCGGGNGGGPPENLILSLGSVDGTVGEEVCVDLRATNFTDLTQLSFSIVHDPANIRFRRAINFGLSSITTANLGSPGLGEVVFDWTSPGSDGETLPPNATLATICYQVNRVAVTPLSFSNSPNTIQARNEDNQNVGIVPSNGGINPNAPVTDGLTFQIGSATGDVGNMVCLPVIGYEATNIVSFQFRVDYDPARLRYTGPGTDFAFNGLNAGAFNEAPTGSIRVAWADGLANGNTVPDGTAIFYLCFEILSTDLTLVTFGDPNFTEFENEDGIVDADLLNGQVNGTAAPVIASAGVSAPACRDGNDGSIVLTVSGGNNLSYRWSPNVTTTGPTATNLSPGNYSVTVTNQTTGLSTSDNYTVPNQGVFGASVGSVMGVTCNGDSNGSITISTTGSTGPYLFDWNGSLPDGSATQINLSGGSYSVTVTDDNGCRRTLPNIMVGEPDEIDIIGSPTAIAPGGTGGITVEVEGGRAPYDYSWDGPGGFSSNSEDLINLTAPGTYCLTVTDNSDCTDVQCFSVMGQLAVISTVVNVGCADQADGSIDITVSGGSGNYDYSWGDGTTIISNDQDLTGLNPGEYTVTITSGSSQITQTVNLDPATPIVIDGTVTPANSGDNGAIVLTVTGGTTPYSFLWDDGVTTQNRTGLASGQHCVTVTDANDCTADRCFTVGSAAAAVSSVSTTPTSCSDSDDGRVRAVLTNVAVPLTVRVEPTGATSTSPTNTVEVDLPAGTYTLFFTDAQGVMLDTTVSVSAPEPLTANPVVTSDTEDTDCTGMIVLEIAGGTAPYDVSWSDMGTGATRSLLCAGDYVAVVTDANGCTLTAGLINVGRIDEELVAITDVACEDGTEGGIDVSITGGSTPYTFAWTRSGTPAEVIADTEDLTGQPAGDYRLRITDATGASLTRDYTIGISAGFVADAMVTSDFNGFGTTCAGAEDGRIVITLSGQGDFMFEFTRDGSLVGTDSILDNAAAGTYLATVIDEGGCEASIEVEVTAPPAIVIDGTITDLTCAGETDGVIAIAPSGGVGGYSVAWSTEAETPRISGLATGDYSVTVTDANGCTSSETYTLTGPEDLAITFEATPATEGCNGSIQVIPLGGSGNYTYVWPQLSDQGNNPFAEGLCPGAYTVEVSDDNDCQTVVMEVVVTDRRFPCLSVRDVISPNGDGLNESFVITCSDGDEALNNSLQIFNRYGQRVYNVTNYQCSDTDRGINCFEGRTNDGVVLPDGPYFYIFEFTNLIGEEMQQRGSITIVRD